ncbi:RICIN domain-containing protein [Nonomuraea ferruginea]
MCSSPRPPAPAPLRQVFTLSGGQLKAAHSGRCLGVKDASTSAGKAVQQETCTSAASQSWQFTTSGSNYRIVNANSAKCLNVKDNSTSSGAALQQNSCDSVATKQWTLRPANGGGNPDPDPTPTITPHQWRRRRQRRLAVRHRQRAPDHHPQQPARSSTAA